MKPVRPDPVRPGQESVWDYPRPAVAEPTTRHIVIELCGILLADTRRAVRTLKTGHPPNCSIQPKNNRAGKLVAHAGSSYCKRKG